MNLGSIIGLGSVCPAFPAGLITLSGSHHPRCLDPRTHQSRSTDPSIWGHRCPEVGSLGKVMTAGNDTWCVARHKPRRTKRPAQTKCYSVVYTPSKRTQRAPYMNVYKCRWCQSAPHFGRVVSGMYSPPYRTPTERLTSHYSWPPERCRLSVRSTTELGDSAS